METVILQVSHEKAPAALAEAAGLHELYLNYLPAGCFTT